MMIGVIVVPVEARLTWEIYQMPSAMRRWKKGSRCKHSRRMAELECSRSGEGDLESFESDQVSGPRFTSSALEVMRATRVEMKDELKGCEGKGDKRDEQTTSDDTQRPDSDDGQEDGSAK